MVTVKICDAIMGSGKSQAAITYMNEHPDKKFVYITPYLEEADRIVQSCGSVTLHEPKRLGKYRGSKIQHTKEMLSLGLNIATTHQAFKLYDAETLDIIRSQKYTMIIDENIDFMEKVDDNAFDIQVLIEAGYLEEVEPDKFRTSTTKDAYRGEMYNELLGVMTCRDLIRVNTGDGEFYFYWQLPIDLIGVFEEVFVLTYLFEGQGLSHFLQLYNVPYTHIGISHPDPDTYRFDENGDYVPAYVKNMKSMIDICQNEKLNSVGDPKGSLSVSWYRREKDNRNANAKKLKDNIYNYFRNINKGKTFTHRMWSTFKVATGTLSGNGYTKAHISFNERATNKHRDKDVLAYCVNIYMNVGQKIYLQSCGIDVNEDTYALSTMLQWIWRSSIRDGNKISIYVPSQRMRTLLENWIEEVSK